MPGATFQNVVQLYVFDKRLRLLVLDAIERLEVTFRVDVAYLLGEKDPFAYMKPDLLHGHFTKKVDSKTGQTRYQDWLLKHAQLIQRSKDDFVEHYKTKYGLPLPIWVAIELWDFGLLSVFYKGMMVKDKAIIAQKYNIPDWQIMESWLRTLNYVRNVAAHHNRFWNRNLIDQPKLAKNGEMLAFEPLIGNVHATSRVYGVLCILAHFMSVLYPRSKWHTRVVELVRTFSASKCVSIHDMGFPTDWEQHVFWQSEE